MKYQTSIQILIATLLVASIVSAFGVTSPTLPGVPIYIDQGQSKEVYFELQNMVGNEDIEAQVTIVGGSEIATLVESDRVDVPFGTKVNVPILLTVPSDAVDGTRYEVAITFRTRAADIQQPIQLLTELQSGIIVYAGDKPAELVQAQVAQEITSKKEEQPSNYNYLYFAILLIVVIWLIFKFARKKR